jgi:hypothetical protein
MNDDRGAWPGLVDVPEGRFPFEPEQIGPTLNAKVFGS